MKITDIITETPLSRLAYGAPMGRRDIGTRPITITSGPNSRILKKNQVKVYEKRVHLDQGYDIGGAYWGCPSNLYVRFTKDLSYVEYFRKD